MESELKDQAKVMRVNVRTPGGAAVARSQGIRGVPTFMVFNGRGGLVYREVGIPDVQGIYQAVERAGVD